MGGEYDDEEKLWPVSYQTINPYGGTMCRPSFARVNADAIGCVWTDEIDLKTLRVDRRTFLNREEVADSKI